MSDFKLQYGEVFTSEEGVNYLLDQLPTQCWSNPNFTWLDIGAGTGNITKIIIEKLHNGLKHIMKDYEERDKHIKENMIYMSEINPFHKKTLLNISKNLYEDIFKISKTFDIVVSNPPYVIQGQKKTPSKRNISKKNDGKTVWPLFVEKAFELSNLFCCLIIPPLWMRNNPGNSRDTIVKNIYKCRCLDFYNANKIFFKKGQTPVSLITLSKSVESSFFYDSTYILFNPIENIYPMDNYKIIKKLIPYVNEYGNIKAIKTNLPPKNVKFSDLQSKQFPYKNIKTTMLTGTVYNYSNKPLKYRFPKIVLAHKSIGLPFYDEEGLGLSTRDNYIIDSDSSILLDFLKSDFVKKIFESFRYRMRFLEKEVFLYLPRVDLIPFFPEVISEDSLNIFFKINNNGKQD